MEAAKIDLDCFALRLDLTASLSLEREQEFFLPFGGVVVGERLDDDKEKPGEIRLGEVGLHLIKNGDAIEEYGSPEAVFDVADGIYQHSGRSSVVTSDVAVTITQMRHTFDLLMFINSDERRDSDPFYRLAYSFVSLPLVRSMIDGLYNVSSMLTFPKRAHDFRLVGFKNMLAALDAEEKLYGDEPGWKEYVANERWKVRVGREAAGFSEADLAGKVRWPTLSVYLQKDPEEDDEHQSFMRRFTYGPWRQYSEISHMTGAGLHDIFAYLNVDSIPRDRRQYVLNRSEKELAMHLGRAATVLLSLVTEVQAKFRFHGHGVDERLQLVWPKVAQFPFGKELYEARYKELLNNSPKHA